MDQNPEPRGVTNPRVIDLIDRDVENNRIVLAMLENRPWGSAEEQFQQIQDKLNSYLAYVQAGYLTRDYPQYENTGICFELQCVDQPGKKEEHFLQAVTHFCAEEGLEFRVVIDPELSLALQN